MREINIEAGAPPTLVRALVAGTFKTGKTHFAATAPAPLFIADAAEAGYNTLFEMDPELWWDPKVTPTVWAIERFVDVGKVILPRLEAAMSEGRFPWRTIIIDPISLYSDRVLAEMQQAEPGKDNRQVYGDLGTHLRALIIRYNALPAHVLWLSHTKEGEHGAELAIQGQTSGKLGAWVDFVWATNVVTVPNRPPHYELRTAPFRNLKFLGGRWKLPDPITPSFKAVAAALRMKETPVSPKLPGPLPAVPVTAPANGQQEAVVTTIHRSSGGFRPPKRAP